MANPKQAQDPAAAALSAIEEALNLSDLQTITVTPKKEPPQSDAGGARRIREGDLMIIIPGDAAAAG